MKIFIRIMRILLGVVLLGAFVYGFYIAALNAPHASDIPEPAESSGPAVEYLNTPSLPEPTPEITPEPTPEITPEPTPEPDSPAARAAALGLPEPPDIDIDSWEFVLVNGDNSIGDYVPAEFGYLNPMLKDFDIQTSGYGGRVAFDRRICQPLLDFTRAAYDEGYGVYLSSGYRSFGEQADNFVRVCQNNGVSDGKDSNGNYITMPAGCSEHQTGMCCDITDQQYNIKSAAELENKPLYIWMAAHCQEYGFILRFPKGGEEYTNVMYEPWHFRYVGVEAATYIMENGLTLEQFVELYR